jgi:hypothetical protein
MQEALSGFCQQANAENAKERAAPWAASCGNSWVRKTGPVSRRSALYATQHEPHFIWTDAQKGSSESLPTFDIHDKEHEQSVMCSPAQLEYHASYKSPLVLAGVMRRLFLQRVAKRLLCCLRRCLACVLGALVLSHIVLVCAIVLIQIISAALFNSSRPNASPQPVPE